MLFFADINRGHPPGHNYCCALVRLIITTCVRVELLIGVAMTAQVSMMRLSEPLALTRAFSTNATKSWIERLESSAVCNLAG